MVGLGQTDVVDHYRCAAVRIRNSPYHLLPTCFGPHFGWWVGPLPLATILPFVLGMLFVSVAGFICPENPYCVSIQHAGYSGFSTWYRISKLWPLTPLRYPAMRVLLRPHRLSKSLPRHAVSWGIGQMIRKARPARRRTAVGMHSEQDGGTSDWTYF